MNKEVCTRCRKAKKRCDGENPCGRCVSLGRADTCSNAETREVTSDFETGIFISLNLIPQPAVRLIVANGGSGHVSVNSSMTQLMRIPQLLARAIIQASTGLPYVPITLSFQIFIYYVVMLVLCLRLVHPADRRQEALASRWLARTPHAAPIIRDVRMLRPIWKIKGIVSRDMRIASDSDATPAKYQRQLLRLVDTTGTDLRAAAGGGATSPTSREDGADATEGFSFSLDPDSFSMAMLRTPDAAAGAVQSSSTEDADSAEPISLQSQPSDACRPSPDSAGCASSVSLASSSSASSEPAIGQRIPAAATYHEHKNSATASNDAVYRELLQAASKGELSPSQQAAFDYIHERLAGFEVIVKRFVCFLEYDEGGLLKAETRYCIGWTPVQEVVDVQTGIRGILREEGET